MQETAQKKREGNSLKLTVKTGGQTAPGRTSP